MRVGPKAKPGESSPPRRGSPLAPSPCASRADGSQPSPRVAPHELLKALQHTVKVEKYETGAVVQRVAEPCRALYFVREGKLQALSTAKDGAPRALGEGDYFGGELAFGAAARVQVVAATACVLSALYGADAESLCREHPHLLRALTDAEQQKDDSGSASAKPSSVASPAPSFSSGKKGGGGGAVDARLLAGLDQRIGWVQTSVESVGAKLGSMEAEVSKMVVAHEGLERRVVGALEQILHRVNEMERKMPRGRAGM